MPSLAPLPPNPAVNRISFSTGAICSRWLLRLLLASSVLALGACASTGDTDITATWSAAKLYREASDEMANGAYDTATKYFEKLESRYPYGILAQQALMEVAYGYYKQGERAQAVAACDRFLKIYPNNPYVDYVLYLKGLSNFYANQTVFTKLADQAAYERDQRGAKASYEAFRDLVTRFPDSKYAPDSIARMKYLVNALAANEVHVAKYYLKREAYVAAANRAKEVLKTYPEAPALEEALGIMVVAYDKLGLTDLRDDALRVLTLNFPNSPYAKGVDIRGKAWYRPW